MPDENPFEDYPRGADESRPELADDQPIVVRHHFYLEAMRLLGNAEAREARFDLWQAANAFGRCELLQSALAAVGSSRAALGEANVDLFVMGIARPDHHNRHCERWLDDVRAAEPAAAQLVRDAAYSFISAWCHRYGGISSDMTDNGTFIRSDRRRLP